MLLMQVFSLSYGVFAGLRGFLFSILATRLMEQLRYACIRSDAIVPSRLPHCRQIHCMTISLHSPSTTEHISCHAGARFLMH